MKITAKLLIPLLSFAILAGCAQTEESPSANEPSVQQAEVTNIADEYPYEKIPVIDAYYEGQKIWFVHTDVSDAKMAQRLTKMVNYRTHHAQKLSDISIENIGKLYVFTNGISQKGVKPWGGGPFNYQIDIFDTVPGDPDYTPVRQPHLVTWNEDATPRVLKTMAELIEAESNGELAIKATGVVVNVPIVKWPSGQSRL